MKTGVLVLGHDPSARLVGQCQLAEAGGYDYFWHADERFFREVYGELACCAVGTSRIRLGPCVTDPHSRHPALTAMAIATLDEISGGRAALAIGAGVSGFRELGIPGQRPVVAMREAVGLIRRLLAGETVDVQGEVVRFHRGGLHFRPVRADVPIYIASNGRHGQALAGEIADGAIMPACVSDRALGVFLANLRAGAARVGRTLDGIDVVVRINTCVSRDSRVARDAVKPGIARYLISQQPIFHTFVAAGLEVTEDLRALVRGQEYTQDAAVLEGIARAIPDAFVEALSLAGTAEEVAAQAAGIARAGVTQLVIHPMSPDGDVEGQIRLFAEEVMPRVRRAAV